jgi:hypothetical protein
MAFGDGWHGADVLLRVRNSTEKIRNGASYEVFEPPVVGGISQAPRINEFGKLQTRGRG